MREVTAKAEFAVIVETDSIKPADLDKAWNQFVEELHSSYMISTEQARRWKKPICKKSN